jgi:competence protein ComGC
MFTLVLLVSVILLICWYIIKDSKKPLTEKFSTALEKTSEKVVDVLDLNNDGKITTQDATELVKKGKIVANKVSTQVKRKYNKKRNHPK